METADTSVLIPLFSSWHEAHGEASRRCRGITRLPAHAMLECYSVMTRLPEPHRVAPEAILDFLERFGEPLTPASSTGWMRAFLRTIGDADVRGGQTYDALIAASALAHDALLLTRDARAAAVYDAIGARVEFIG